MSDQNQIWQPHDVLTSFALLSRLPVPVDHSRAGRRGAQAAWAYPLVGLVLGGAAGLLGWLLQWLGLPFGMIAVFVLAVLVLATGAMHEDGLADCADGIWGGHTPARRLEIMKDSRIGAYGAIALVLALLARWSGIISLHGPDLVLTLAAIGAASRAMMVVVMYALQPARKTGLAASTGSPGAATTATALLIGLLACLLTGLSGFILFAIIAAFALPLAKTAQRLLGGHTGDVLGGTQQITEIAGLAAAIALL